MQQSFRDTVLSSGSMVSAAIRISFTLFMRISSLTSGWASGVRIGRVGVVLVLAVLIFVPGLSRAAGVSDYTTGSGDRLKVTVFGHSDLSGQFLIDGSGSIAMPLIGDIAIGGFTVREIEVAIVAKLVPDYLKNPRVSVEVLNYRPFYILGEVKRPGSYPYVSGMTVITAVALGGGYTYRARENNIYITRATDEKRLKQAAKQNTQVLPGDIVEVPERFF